MGMYVLSLRHLHPGNADLATFRISGVLGFLLSNPAETLIHRDATRLQSDSLRPGSIEFLYKGAVPSKVMQHAVNLLPKRIGS